MGSVIFTYFHDSRELEIDVDVVRAYRSHKLAGVNSITEDGARLKQTEVEELTEEIGDEALLSAAVKALNSEEEEDLVLDQEDLQLMDELNIEVG